MDRNAVVLFTIDRLARSPHGQKMAKPSGLLREIDQKCLKRQRIRRRRLHVYSTDPRRPQGDLFGRDRQDSTARPPCGLVRLGAANQEITFFGPQYVSHRSLWTISELIDTQTAACRVAPVFSC